MFSFCAMCRIFRFCGERVAAKLLFPDRREGRVWAKPNRGVGGSATDQATLWGKSSTFDTECLCLLRGLVKAFEQKNEGQCET